MKEIQNHICLNCETKSASDHLYCSNCGQQKNLPRLTFKQIVSDFFSSVFNIDAPFFKTAVGLLISPSKLISDVIKGRRKCYYAPVKYMVLCLFISLLVGEIVGFDPIENQKSFGNANPEDESTKMGYEIGNFLSQYLNYFTFLLPLLIALISKLFFWKNESNLAERSVLGLYVTGQYSLLSILPLILTLINPKFIFLFYAISVVYFTYSFYSFFLRNSKIKTIIKSIIASIFAILLYYLVATFIAIFIIKYFKIEA